MKVVFTQDVKNVASKGEVKDVAPGHARNFLFPRGLAKPATDSAMKEVAREKEERQKDAEADLLRTEALAAKLDGYELELKAKASPAGTLYAAVTVERVADELKRRGLGVMAHEVQLPDDASIKEAGEYEVKINLDHGLEAEMKVIIESES